MQLTRIPKDFKRIAVLFLNLFDFSSKQNAIEVKYFDKFRFCKWMSWFYHEHWTFSLKPRTHLYNNHKCSNFLQNQKNTSSLPASHCHTHYLTTKKTSLILSHYHSPSTYIPPKKTRLHRVISTLPNNRITSYASIRRFRQLY